VSVNPDDRPPDEPALGTEPDAPPEPVPDPGDA
jgi:hypothetical protein